MERVFGRPEGWRHLVLCEFEWFSQVLAGTLAAYMVSEGWTPIIVDVEGTFRLEVLENISKRLDLDLLGKTVISREVPRVAGKYAAVLLHPRVREHLYGGIPRIVISRRSEVGRVKGLRRVYVRRITDRVFQLELRGRRLKVEASPEGVAPWKPRLSGLQAAAYRALQEALTEYGPLSTVDAITVIAGTLKVRKEDARRILQDLLDLGAVVLSGKQVLIG